MWTSQNEKVLSFGNYISIPEMCFYFATSTGAKGIEGICVSSGAILSCLATQPWCHLYAHWWFSVYRRALVFVLLFNVDHGQMHISHGKSNKKWPKHRTGNKLVIHLIYEVVIKIVIKIIFSSKNNQGFKYRKN